MVPIIICDANSNFTVILLFYCMYFYEYILYSLKLEYIFINQDYYYYYT